MGNMNDSIKSLKSEVDSMRNEVQKIRTDAEDFKLQYTADQEALKSTDEEYMDKEMVDELAQYENDVEKARTLVQRSKKEKVTRAKYLSYIWSFFYNKKQKGALIFNSFLLFVLTAFYIGNPVIIKNLVDSMQLTLASPAF